MNETGSISYYLGGNTADGFYSLYDGFVSLSGGDFLWVIKGGAGCGKSGFMRRIADAAEAKGLAVERVLCSGDPDSLDGIYIPALKTAYMDGTAPHIADANLTAVDSCYLDLSRFYNLKAISAHRDELLSLKKANSLQYGKAYALINGIGGIRRGWLGSGLREEDISSAEKRVKGILKRELGTKKRPGGTVTRRFLSAMSCRGLCSLTETAEKLCSRFCILDSRLGLAPKMLELAAREAFELGHSVILCPDPITPEVPEAVLIPDAGIGFIASGSGLSSVYGSRRIHLDPKPDASERRKIRSELGKIDKLTSALEAEALSALASAKAIHDNLERIYNPYVNFDGVYKTAQEHIKALGLK